jgi:hypothetical protein
MWVHATYASPFLPTTISTWNFRAIVAGRQADVWLSQAQNRKNLQIVCMVVRFSLIPQSIYIEPPLLLNSWLFLSTSYFCRDYTNPSLPVAPSAIDGSGQVKCLHPYICLDLKHYVHGHRSHKLTLTFVCFSTFLGTVWYWSRWKKKGAWEQCVAGVYWEHAICCDYWCATHGE